jgi:glycosyltransferase involved in cell wall biosynthesis
LIEFAHISLFERVGKSGIKLGGVEKFGMYLHRAVPKVMLISWSDYPKWVGLDEERDYDKASILNDYLLSEGILGEKSTVVVDGYWGLGLQGKVKRLISVVHGTYFGRFIQSQIYPWGETVFMDHSEAQIELWNHDQTEVVAVSDETAKELRNCTIKTDFPTIRHGIDLEVFRPMGLERKGFMHAATSARKGLDVIMAMQKHGCIISPMNERSGHMEREAKRFNQFRWLVSPTRHEGNAYLLLESLACGTPVITYPTGIAPELLSPPVIVSDDLTWPGFMRKVKWANEVPDAIWEEEFSKRARRWAVQNCSFERFADDWRKFLA